MLPYSPLHHLLLTDAGSALVMTSGNVSDEPIAYGDDDALTRLTGIADMLLVHDRPIETRTDDSVLRAVAVGDPDANGDGRFRPMFMRRSRGYVPASIPLPDPAERPILACGAELKSTFCVAKGSRAWVSHHIGDLQNYETLRSFTDGIRHFERLFSVQPEIIVHDLHPEYLSTKYALELELEGAARWRGLVSSGSPSSTTMLTWRRASPSTVCRAAPSERSSMARATGPTGPCGAASCWSATWPASGAPERCAGPAPRRRARDPPALADGLRLADQHARRAISRPPLHCEAPSTSGTGDWSRR